MHVRIANRFRPFSHKPGAACLIPGTDIAVQAFPTKIVVGDLDEISLPYTGPVTGFTLLQDLEKGEARVFGHAKEGYYCYRIYAGEGEIHVGEKKISARVTPFQKPKERLSFGCTKKLDWDNSQRRADPKEVLPVWYALSQMTPKGEGSHPLLEEAIASKQTGALMRLFAGGFSQILVPKMVDENYLGLCAPSGKGAPSALIARGGALIRSLFIQSEGGVIRFLPHLPKGLVCGRMTGVTLDQGLTVDFVWSKSKLRQAVFHSDREREITLHPGSGLSTFRLRKSLKDKGLHFNCTNKITINNKIFIDNLSK